MITDQERRLILRQKKLRKLKQEIMTELKQIQRKLIDIRVEKRNKIMEKL